MTDQQENRLSRNEKVNAFLVQHQAELAATPAIATLQSQLADINEKMRADDEHAVQDNTGYADSKKDIEENLENLVDHIGSGLESYADDTDDFVLMNSVEFTLSQIQAFRDNRLLQYAQFVYNKASDAVIKPVLIAEHNITNEDISRLVTLIKQYTDASPLPQQMKGEAVAWGKQVDRDLAEADKILARIRRKMNTFRLTNRFLFDAFTAVDSVDDTGSHKGKKKTIGAGQTDTVQSIAYVASAPFSLENTSGTLLGFRLYDNNVAVGNELEVAPGNKLAGTFADFGASAANELRVTNKDASSAGSYIAVL